MPSSTLLTPALSHPVVQEGTPTAEDKTVLRKLERKEILENTESGYRFQVPLVREYVEQVVEEEE